MAQGDRFKGQGTCIYPYRKWLRGDTQERVSPPIKSSALQIAGVILDADTTPRGRYASIRSLCVTQFPNLPPELPAGGLIVENAQKKRLGVWIMPNNASDGSTETFLKWLVPDRYEATWKYAEQAVQAARVMGCPCRDVHVERAYLYTWLAWQDPPGQSPGVAIAKKVLDAKGQSAAIS